MEEMEVEELTPEMIYRPKDLVWVKISGMWWPCEVMDQETLSPDVTKGLKKKPLVVVKFLQEENSYEFVRSLDIIYHYNCKRKEEFLALGFKKYYKLKNEKNMALFPATIQEAERRTGGDPEIVSDPKYRPQEAQGPSTVENGGRSSLPADFKGFKVFKNSAARRRSAPGPSKDGDQAKTNKSKTRRPAIIVKQGPSWDPYPKQINVIFPSRRKPPSDDPSVKQMPLHHCSLCCFQTPYFNMLELHHNSNQHVTSTHPGTYYWRNPLNKNKITSGSKKKVVRRKKDSASTSAEKGSAKRKKKVLPPVPVGEFTPPKKPKMSLPGTPNSLEVSQECAKIIEEWTEDEEENKPSDETVDELDRSAYSVDNTMETAELGKDLVKLSNLDTSTPKVEKPSGTPKSSSCFDFDEEEPSEPGLQSSGKFGQIRLPRVITPEKSKPPDPLGDGNDIDSLLKEVSVPDIPSLPTSKQDSLFSRGDRTYGSSPFKDTKKPGITSPVRSDSNKDKSADVENNMNEDKHFLAKGPLQSKKRKSFGRTEGAEDGSDVKNKSKAGASPPKPSNEKKIDGKTSKIAAKTSAAELAKQSLIDTLTYSPKSDDEVQEMAESKKLSADEALSNKVSQRKFDTIGSVQSTPKPSRKSNRKKEHTKPPSLSVEGTSRREASPEEPGSPRSSRRNKKFKSSKEVQEPGGTSKAGPMQSTSEHAPSDITRNKRTKKVGSPEGDLKVLPELQSDPKDITPTVVVVNQETTESMKSASATDASDSVQSAPRKASRKRSMSQKPTESPSLPVDGILKTEASPEEPESSRSGRRSKKIKSSLEAPELLSIPDSTSKVDIAQDSIDLIESPSSKQVISSNDNITHESVVEKPPRESRKSKKLGSSEVELNVQSELLSEMPELPKKPDLQSAPSKQALPSNDMAQEPEVKKSPRTSKKTETGEPEVQSEKPAVPVDDTSKAGITQEHTETGSLKSSKQALPSNDIAASRKSRKLGSSSGEEQTVLSDTHETPELLSMPADSTLNADITQESTQSIESSSSEQVLPPNDITQEPMYLKPPRESRKTKIHESSEMEQVESVPDQDPEQFKLTTRSATVEKSPKTDEPHKWSRRSQRNRPQDKMSSNNEIKPASIPLPEDCLPESVFSVSHQKIPQESCESLVSPIHEASRSLISSQASLKVDGSPRVSRRSKRLNSQELPVSIPLPEGDFPNKENTLKISESLTSPTRDEASHVHSVSLVDESPKSSEKSKKPPYTVEVPVSIPLPEKDLPKDGCAVSEFIHSDESPRSSRKTRESKASEASKLKTLPSGEALKSDYITAVLGEDSEAVKPQSTNETSNLDEPEDSKAEEQLRSTKKSEKHKLPQEETVPILEGKSVVLEEPKPMESAKDDPTALIPEALACNDSKSQPSHAEEPHNVESTPAADSSEPLKSPSADMASTLVTEDSNANEPRVPSRKSRRIASQGDSESPCEVDKQKTETKANELSGKKSNRPTLSLEPESALPSVGESATLKLPEELEPMEPSKDDPTALKHGSMLFGDSKSLTLPTEEPLNVEAIPPAEDSHLTSSCLDSAVQLAEDFKAVEPVAPSRKSRRISAQEALTPKTEIKANEQPSKKSKRHTLPQEPESKLSSVVESDTLELQEELKPIESSKDDPMTLIPEAMACNDSKSVPPVAEDPHNLETENSGPVKLPSVGKVLTQVTAEESKANEPLTPIRKSKRISSQEVPMSKSLLKADSPKTESTASEIPQGNVEPTELSSCDEALASKVSVETVPAIQEHPALHEKGNRQETEKMPEAKPVLEEDKPLTTKVPPSQKVCEDLGENVVDKLTRKEISPKPSSKKSKHVEPKLLTDVVNPKPDHKKVSESRSPFKEAKSKEQEKTAHTKEKDRKSASKSYWHEKSRRESMSVSKEAKNTSKVSPREDRSRSESKTSKRRSTSKEKKRKDKDEESSASTAKPASQVDVDPKGSLVGVDSSASSFELISNKVMKKESPQPCKDKFVGGALFSPSKDAAPSQKSVSNDLFDSSSPRKKKSKWDVDGPKVEETSMDTVETTKNVDSNCGAMMNVGESGLKPLEITVFDCSENAVAIDKDLAESYPKKQMAHSPSKTFRQDEAASLLEELLGSSPKSSPTSSPKKTNSVSPVKVPHDSSGRRSRTADIKFSLSPSKVLDFGFPPKANDASENRTENLGPSLSNAALGMADASVTPVRASRWDSPIKSSGIRSSTPTQSLGVSPANTSHSPGRKVKVWEIKSGARSGFKSSLPDVAPDEPPKLPVRLEPDSSNNQSDDDLSALQAEIMSYSPMDQAKSTPAPVVMKEVSDLVKELEDPPNSLQPQTTPAAIHSCNTVQGKKLSFSSPNKSIDSTTSHVGPEAIPLPPFKPSSLSEADLLADLSDAVIIPLNEPVTSESVTSIAPDTISSTKPSAEKGGFQQIKSATPNLIIVPPSDSTQGSDSIPCLGNEKQSLGNGLAQNFGSGQEMLLDINSMVIIMDDNLTYSEAPVTTATESISSLAEPIVSTEPVLSIPLPSEKPFKQSPPICAVSSAPSLTTSGQGQTSTVTVKSISLPLEPSVQKPTPDSPTPELEEVSKEEVIETEIVMDHSETEEQDCLTALSSEEKFAQALVKQPWLRPDLLEDLTKRATDKKVYEVRKATQLVISLYDEDHPDYSYYMSLPPCQVGTSNYTPSWAAVGPQKNVSSTNPVSSVTKPTSVNSRQTPTTNHSSARLEKVGGEVADSSKPVSGASPAKAAGAQVKQKILQILNQLQSGKCDAETARKLESSITSRPGFMDKINQQQKIMVSSHLPAEMQPKKTAVNAVVRASPSTKTMTSIPGSTKSVMVVNTSNARGSQPKPNILSPGREPLKFTMESKYRNIQVSSSNPTKYVVVPDPVTGIPAVKQQIIIRNTNAQSGNTLSGRIVTTQSNSAASPGRIVTTQSNSSASPGPGRSTVPGTMPTFTMVSSRSTSTLQTVVSTPGRSTLLGKTQATVPGSSTVKMTTTLPHQPRQRLKTVAQPAVIPTARLSSQPQTVRVRKQSLGQTQFVQRPMTGKTETITYVTIPNNMVIPTSSEQIYVVTKKKPPVAPNSDILAEALAGAEIPFTEDPSPDLLSPASVVITGSLGADQLSTMPFDPAETDNVNR